MSSGVFRVPCRESGLAHNPPPLQTLPLAPSPGFWLQSPWNVVILGQHMPTRAMRRHRPWALHRHFHLCPLLRDLGGGDGEGSTTTSRGAALGQVSQGLTWGSKRSSRS